MPEKLTKEEAKKFLGPVPIENIFHVYEGPTCINLYELVESLQDMPDWQYSHHVNENRSDFLNWIHDCITDKTLVSQIRRVKKRETLIKKIKDRIKVLENASK